MNRIVRENYPVSKLPEELRDALDGQSEVTLTIDWGSDRPKVEMLTPKSLDDLFAMARPTFRSLDEVTAHIRSLRDQWS